MKVGEATVYRHTKGQTLYISIPSKMAQDSACPVSDGDKVKIEFIGKKMVIEKVDTR